MLKQRDIPREIVIRDNIWTVRFVRQIEPPVNGQITLGLCDPSEHLIKIKMGQKPRERLKTFFHELVHAICEEYGIRHTERHVKRLEEPIVAFVLENLYGVMTQTQLEPSEERSAS